MTSLLPGLRDLRTPLITGYLYLLLAWLALGGQRLLPDDPTNTFLQRLYDLSDALGVTVTLAAVSFCAYLLGSLVIVQEIPALLSRTRAGRPAPRARLRHWVWEATGQKYGRGSDAEFLLESRAMGDGFTDHLRNRITHEYSQLSDRERRARKSGDPRSAEALDELDKRGAFVELMTNSITGERDVLVVRMQIERESLYNAYDRLRAEAELRFSLFAPLVLLTVAGALLWSPWALVALLVPGALAAQGNQQAARAEEQVWQALTTGVIQSPTMEQYFAL